VRIDDDDDDDEDGNLEMATYTKFQFFKYHASRQSIHPTTKKKNYMNETGHQVSPY